MWLGVPKSNIRYWNKTAIECYERGCICEGCPINELYFKNKYYRCQMKSAVIELVRILGLPPQINNGKRMIIED